MLPRLRGWGALGPFPGLYLNPLGLGRSQSTLRSRRVLDAGLPKKEANSLVHRLSPCGSQTEGDL